MKKFCKQFSQLYFGFSLTRGIFRVRRTENRTYISRKHLRIYKKIDTQPIKSGKISKISPKILKFLHDSNTARDSISIAEKKNYSYLLTFTLLSSFYEIHFKDQSGPEEQELQGVFLMKT